MLSSWTFRYSGVSGACCAGPHALVGSNLIAWPPRRGLIGSHWPFQLGYFASSAARAPPIDSISATANANAPAELRYDIKYILPCVVACLIAIDANSCSCGQDTLTARRREHSGLLPSPAAREGSTVSASLTKAHECGSLIGKD